METARVWIIYTADTMETMFSVGLMAAKNKRMALFSAFVGLIKTNLPEVQTQRGAHSEAITKQFIQISRNKPLVFQP